MYNSVVSANEYINLYVINIEDWTDCDEAKKIRLLNVAYQTLSDKYPDYIIPDEAAFDFAARLATITNDTNKLQLEGVAGFSIPGAASFTFKDAGKELSEYIPQSALSIIGKQNGVKLGGRRPQWGIM